MNEERSLGEQLRQETRVCHQCGYSVLFPMVQRCPRCYALLPSLELSCSGCMHNISCPVKDVKSLNLTEAE